MKYKKEIIFIGAKKSGYLALKKLVGAKLKIFAVIVKKNTENEEIINFSNKHNIKVYIIKNFEDKKLFENIVKLEVTTAISVSFPLILPLNFLNIFSNGVYNIHFADLPYYRGLYPTIRPIINNEKYAFICIHKMDKGIDTGPILLKLKIPIYKIDTGWTLYLRLINKVPILLGNAIPIIFNKNKKFKLNSRKNSNYYNTIPNNGIINWDWKGEQIVTFVRALNHKNERGAVASLGANYFHVKKAKFIKNVNLLGRNFLGIPCSNGFIKFLDFNIIKKNNQSIVVVGTGGHARSVASAILSSGGTIDYFVSLDKIKFFLGYKVKKNIYKYYNSTNVVIAIGDNYRRKKIYDELIKSYKNLKFPAIVCSSAKVSQNAIIDDGSVVLQDVIIGTNSVINKFCILNTSCSVDHDNVIKSFSSVGPKATLAGNVKIGNNVALGIDCTILQNINIGSSVVVGAKSLVNKNFDRNLVIYGTPAKIIRKRKNSSKYL